MRTVLLSLLITVLAVSVLSLVGCPKSETAAPDDAAVTPPGPPSPDGEKGSELSIDIPEGKPGEEPPAGTAAGPEGGTPPSGPPGNAAGAEGGGLPEGWGGGNRRGGDGPPGEGAPGDGERRVRRDPAEMFAQFDKNSDGKLTKDELPERFGERMMRADANGDGALTKEELDQARRNRRNRGGDGPPSGGGE